MTGSARSDLAWGVTHSLAFLLGLLVGVAALVLGIFG
jgi:hypothetical protein